MSRLTTLAALAVFALATALLSGCDSGKTGTSPNKTQPPPPTENLQKGPSAEVPPPPK
jgi:hypothetical protein